MNVVDTNKSLHKSELEISSQTHLKPQNGYLRLEGSAISGTCSKHQAHQKQNGFNWRTHKKPSTKSIRTVRFSFTECSANYDDAIQTVQAKPQPLENSDISTPPSACARQSSHESLLWLLKHLVAARARPPALQTFAGSLHPDEKPFTAELLSKDCKSIHDAPSRRSVPQNAETYSYTGK